MHYLKHSDLEYFKQVQKQLNTVQKELNTVEQTDEIKQLTTGVLNHSTVAKIFYDGFHWKYQYSNANWYRLSKGGIYQLLIKDSEVLIAKEIYNYMKTVIMDVAETTTDNDKLKKLWTALGKVESYSFKVGCVAESKSKFINENLYKELDIKDHLIGFNNGLYDLQLGEFRIGTVEDKISMNVGYDYSPDYDEKDYKFIEDTIEGYFKDADTARWFKKHLGSLLEGGNIEEYGYFWVGNGRNGKGTLDTMLINTLGDYYYKVNNEFFTAAKQTNGGAEPEILSMKHKRLCMTHEPEGSTKYLTSKFKTNTGNDIISARAMRSDHVEQFMPSHKTIIQTNHLPEFTDIDEGLLQRLVVIKFPFKFCDGDDYEKNNNNHKPIDMTLKNKLKGKENVFINFLINWFNIYKIEGLKDQSDDIKGAVKEYRKEVDSVKSFIEFALEKTLADTDRISTAQLLDEHNQWAKTRLTPKKFTTRLKTNDIETSRRTVDSQKVMAIVGFKYKTGFFETTSTTSTTSTTESTASTASTASKFTPQEE
jgi:P4 family phage/plasmid primase-like protien